ncbi:MAG: TlpA disulfide reductase family protein [Chitinophagales bacterium]
MKRSISTLTQYLIIISLFLSSCNHFKGYEISGKIKNAEGVKVYLEDITETVPVVIDTTTILQSAFELKNYSAKGIYRLRFGEDGKNSIFLYIQEKDRIKVEADLKDLSDYKVDGSKGSFSIQQLSATSKMRIEALDSMYSRLKSAGSESRDSLMTVFAGEKKEYVEFIKKFIENEPNDDVACFALNYMGPMLQDEIPYLVDITEKLHTAAPDSKYINSWYQQTQQYREAIMAENAGGVPLNTQAPDITLLNPSGDTIQLSNLKGNYVLLDFWASWCQPCRMENPNVVALYNKYHAQGFEVFSVSLDANVDQWKKAIAKDGLVWKNHGCDFGGWQSAPAQAYRVESIPCTFLLDKTGKVIAKNLRGEELAAKLAELYAAPAVQ